MLYENGKPDDEDHVFLNRTKFYNFAEPEERGEWFDVFVALIQYLVSGESKAGFLNRHHPANLLNKVLNLLGQNLQEKIEAEAKLETPATRGTDVSLERTGTQQPLRDEGSEVSDKQNLPMSSPRKRARVQSPPSRSSEVVGIGSGSEVPTENPPKRQRGGTI